MSQQNIAQIPQPSFLKDVQSIAYLGPGGSYTEMAKDMFCDIYGLNIRLEPLNSIKRVLQYVEEIPLSVGEHGPCHRDQRDAGNSGARIAQTDSGLDALADGSGVQRSKSEPGARFPAGGRNATSALAAGGMHNIFFPSGGWVGPGSADPGGGGKAWNT